MSEDNTNRVRIDMLAQQLDTLRDSLSTLQSSVTQHMLHVSAQLAGIDTTLKAGNPLCKLHADRLDLIEREQRAMTSTQNKWIGAIAVVLFLMQISLALFGPAIRDRLGLDKTPTTHRP